MNRSDRVRLAATFVGAVLVVAGGRILDNVSGAGGFGAVAFIALGVLMLLVGSGAVVGCWQRLVSWRRVLSYVTLVGGYGLFAISGTVFALAVPHRDPGSLADLFIGMSLGGIVLGLAMVRVADELFGVSHDDPDGGR